MELLLSVLVILVAARLFGEVAERLGQPCIIGQIIAGIVLGPSVLNLIVPGPETESLAMLGIFLLMFIAGMAINPARMAGTGRVASAVAGGGIFLPFVLGFGLGIVAGPYFIPGFSFIHAIILGVCLSISAVGAAEETLIELRRMKSQLGQIIVEAGVLDDMMGLLMLSVITSVIKAGLGNALFSVAGILVDVIIFFAVFGFVGVFIFPRLLRWAGKLKSPQSLFGITIILVMLYSASSEYLLGSGIIGAFMAGVFTRYATEKHAEVENALLDRFSSLALGLLTPLFFVWIGIQLSPGIITEPGLLLFAVLVILAAVFGKVIGAYIPSRINGFGGRESLAIGFGMNARGAVELVIAGIALQGALITQELFSIIVVMALVTTIIAPAAMKALLKKSRPSIRL
jgi:Kef-type K+ transport system membrane component KefB